MKAFLLAAGLGTRLKPFTDHHPKALLPICGKTLLERNISYLKHFGICDVVINIHHFGEQIVEFLQKNQNFGCNIAISDESKELLETGGALLFAKKYFENENHFLMMNSDILTNINLHELKHYHILRKPLATLAISKRYTTRTMYFDSDLRLVGWKNHIINQSIGTITDNAFGFLGIQILSNQIFSLVPQRGKFSILTTYLSLKDQYPILGYPTEEFWIDVGKTEAIPLAEQWVIEKEK